MNTKTLSTLILLASSLLFAACGGHDNHDDHDHGTNTSTTEAEHGHSHADGEEHEHQAFVKDPGPNGGRLITSITPSVEFLLLPDNTAQLTFVDESGKTVPATTQTASLITGDRMNPFTASFVKKGDLLVSEKPLPQIESQPLILTLQATATADASPVIDRFKLNTHTCSGCKLSEYACICGH